MKILQCTKHPGPTTSSERGPSCSHQQRMHISQQRVHIRTRVSACGYRPRSPSNVCMLQVMLCTIKTQGFQCVHLHVCVHVRGICACRSRERGEGKQRGRRKEEGKKEGNEEGMEGKEKMRQKSVSASFRFHSQELCPLLPGRVSHWPDSH